MNDQEAFVAVVALFTTIVVPITLIGHYVTKWRALRVDPNAAQEAASLRATADRLESRIANLESILDSEAPGWRSRSTLR